MFSWFVTGLLLVANILTGLKRRVGWLVGVVADASFAAYGITTRQYGFTVGSVVFAGVRTRNYILWRRQDSSGRLMTGEPQECACASPMGDL